MKAEEIIERLHMSVLPNEGGYFAVTHQSDERLMEEALPARYQQSRLISGAIYYLVTNDQFSAIHKLPTDELYYFHYGDPMEMLLLGPRGEGAKTTLGMGLDSGQFPQLLAPRDWWHGSRPLPDQPYGFTLVSTSMAPAYHESDPVFGEREALQSQYPKHADIIAALTRINTTT